MDLLDRWRTTVAAPDDALALAAGADLLSRWSEPHRRYHDLAHLEAVLDAVDVLREDADDVVAVRLAAWFHDAVYRGQPGADEEASAQLAEAVLAGLAQPPQRIREVARLVRLTASHDPAPTDADGAVLCDADLSILGAPEPVYARYVARVRSEYGHLDDETFRRGRGAVLESLLAMQPLFRTSLGRQRWEQAARANLAGELRQA